MQTIIGLTLLALAIVGAIVVVKKVF